jgi:hypothetical protein
MEDESPTDKTKSHEKHCDRRCEFGCNAIGALAVGGVAFGVLIGRLARRLRQNPETGSGRVNYSQAQLSRSRARPRA